MSQRTFSLNNHSLRWLFVSILFHVFAFILLLFQDRFNNSSYMKNSIKGLGSANTNIKRFKSIRVEVAGLPNVLKKDLKYLNQAEENKTTNTNETIHLPKQKKDILAKLKEKFKKKDEIKEKQNKKPDYLKKLKKIKGIVQSIDDKLENISTDSKVSNTHSGLGSGTDKGSINGENNPYIETVTKLIQIQWKIPMWLKDKNLKAIISLKINKDGSIKNIALIESSGNKKFDSIAKTTIEMASPFPAPPLAIQHKELVISFP